jgi:hypothetical protein
MDRLYIDLMDFRSFMDGPFCWIAQLKDHFSRHIWLEAMENKESLTVANILKAWMHINGAPGTL